MRNLVLHVLLIVLSACWGNNSVIDQDENLCESFPNSSVSAESLQVYYDGVYQAASSGGYWYYLRFYQDGTVLQVSTDGKPEQVGPWLNKKSPYIGTGTYTIDEGFLEFSIKTPRGVIDFDGKIQPGSDMLTLQVHSNINGKIGIKNYKYISVPL